MDYGLYISAGALIVAALSFYFSRKDKGSDKLEEISTSLLKANLKIDSICSTTNETRCDIKTLNRDLIEIDKRVTVLEEKMEDLKHE